MCAMPFRRRSRIARWRSGNGSPRSAGSMFWIASSQRSRGSRRASRRSASASAPRSPHATGCRVASFARPPPAARAAALTSYLAQEGRSTQEVRAAVVASVVPPVTQGLCEAVERATTVRPVVVDGRSRLPITLDVEEPLQVGADRILNTLAAAQLLRRDTIVVDFGTATTFDCITADGHFLGGVIMPGIRTASDALSRGTAKLPATELTPPPRTIGRRPAELIA